MKRIEGAPARKMDDEIPFIQQAGSQSDGGWTA